MVAAGNGQRRPKTVSQLNDLIVQKLPGTITVGNGKTIPDPEYASIKDKLAYFRYRERFRLSYQEMLLEPVDEVYFAIAVWAAEGKRDKIESRKREASAEEQRPNYNRGQS